VDFPVEDDGDCVTVLDAVLVEGIGALDELYELVLRHLFCQDFVEAGERVNEVSDAAVARFVGLVSS